MTEPACTTHKTKADSQNIKNEPTVAGGKDGGGREFGMDMYTQ